jgi:hypothetical protein
MPLPTAAVSYPISSLSGACSQNETEDKEEEMADLTLDRVEARLTVNITVHTS